ncbi:hypothetical protein N3K66_007951 [Trichothecium roseum]|uniref:Uncharacterized protein n=1 Tax=Trichothecium roseum TaxID=47278 RepID=A0ACC0US22_9HYPO|nr:hypothetical protein N3K66_007951 [Trichothecium roseum]
MYPLSLSLVATASLAFTLGQAKSTLFWGATIIAFDQDTEALRVIRNGSLLVTDDRIAAVNTDPSPGNLPEDTEHVDVSEQIITPGFVDTHRHGWQTAFRTLASNTTLAEYIGRYGEFAAAASFTAEDVYLGQLIGLYEDISAGVTTLLDHAHHTWSDETAYAGLNASVESGVRVFWAYTFHNITALNYTVSDQIPNFREIAESKILDGSPTELGIAYDSWGPNPGAETEAIAGLIKEYNVSVMTTHCLGGPWGFDNFPSHIQKFGVLEGAAPIVFSHSSDMPPMEAQLARSTGHRISITPESEMHYGQGRKTAYYAGDIASLGIDTHFTFSGDLLTQARMWMQQVRGLFYQQTLDGWEVPSKNPVSVYQAFMLATRDGGLALRRPDLGVIRPGAKADIIVWDAKSSLSMLGWADPVAAVILHANAGDVLHVLVDGKWKKRDGKVLAEDYPKQRAAFLESARRIQRIFRETEYPVLEGEWSSGYPFASPRIYDTEPGEGNGYGQQFL